MGVEITSPYGDGPYYLQVYSQIYRHYSSMNQIRKDKDNFAVLILLNKTAWKPNQTKGVRLK
jgi:hypothetical protein